MSFRTIKLLCNIAHYGRGPQEFITITGFCLDKSNKHICIYDNESRKLVKYTYNGAFVGKYPLPDLMRSFTNVKGKFICIQPAYLRKMRSGIWTTDSEGKFGKVLVPENSDNVYEALYPHYFNYNDEGISYYDRYDNRLFLLLPDSAYLKYRFNLIPAMPRALKRNEDKGVQDYFLCWLHATILKKYILLFYGSTKEFYQVLYNKADSTYRVTEDLVNDLLPDDKNEVSEHYIDPYTLAVEMSAEEKRL